MKYVLALSFLIISQAALAADRLIVCAPQSDAHGQGLKAIFAVNAQDPKKMDVTLVPATFRGSSPLAILPCSVAGQKLTGEGDAYTTWNCRNSNDTTGYWVTLVSGGLSGFKQATVLKNGTEIAKLPCRVQQGYPPQPVR